MAKEKPNFRLENALIEGESGKAEILKRFIKKQKPQDKSGDATFCFTHENYKCDCNTEKPECRCECDFECKKHCKCVSDCKCYRYNPCPRDCKCDGECKCYSCVGDHYDCIGHDSQ